MSMDNEAQGETVEQIIYRRGLREGDVLRCVAGENTGWHKIALGEELAYAGFLEKYSAPIPLFYRNDKNTLVLPKNERFVLVDPAPAETALPGRIRSAVADLNALLNHAAQAGLEVRIEARETTTIGDGSPRVRVEADILKRL